MPTPDLIMTLGKVIIATAWADGRVTEDEINSLKDLTFRLPELTAHQWAELEMYIDTPVRPAERERLIDQLRRQVSSARDRALVDEALNAMVSADGQVTPEEQAVVEQIEAALGTASSGLFRGFSNLLDDLFQKRSLSLTNAPNREVHFEDYITNKVYYNLSRRLEMGEVQLDLSDAELRKLCLAGGIMAQIAREDESVTDEEFSVMIEALQKYWQLDKKQATFVAEVAVSGATTSFDHLRLSREFVKAFSHAECLKLVDVLFAVAAADGMASNDEIEQIRKIAGALLVSNAQFIQAKLKVPRERRES